VDSPCELTPAQLDRVKAACSGKWVHLARRAGRLSHADNHVTLVSAKDCSDCVSQDQHLSDGYAPLLIRVMPAMSLFDPSALDFYVSYFSGRGDDEGPVDEQFGSMHGVAAPYGGIPDQRAAHQPARTGYGHEGDDAESVVDHGLRAGGSNVSGSVVRRARRKVGALSPAVASMSAVPRNYVVSSGVMFNNLQEMTLDAISPIYAQEVLEEVFSAWGLSFDSPERMKYAEDLVFTFLAATTASDKADFNREYDLPSAPGGGELVASFKVLSDLVVIKHRLTRRQFARGLADRVRSFIKAEQNGALQAALADRAGSHAQYGDLCFDGSTHCTGLTPSERAFVKVLEARNLFESDAVLATGASDKLLSGFNSRQGPRLA